MAQIPAAIPSMPWIKVIDRNLVETKVDGEWQTFARRDKLGGHPMSGLWTFGPIHGDWRMVQEIADDIAAAFKEIDRYIENEKLYDAFKGEY